VREEKRRNTGKRSPNEGKGKRWEDEAKKLSK
jgi:hypothetical protein